MLAVIAKATEDERRVIQAASLRETNAQRALMSIQDLESVSGKNLPQTHDEHGVLIHKTHPLHTDFEKTIDRMDRADDRKTATKAAELFNTNRT
ncbi:hypothetical protein HQ447_08570 [bacterium]|nr:hypothetical protein [bacterium]